MKAAQIIYPLIFIFAIYFIYTNYKNNSKYKKENMKVLFYLSEDDKRRHLTSNMIIILILVISGFMLVGMIRYKNFTLESLFSTVLLPLLMILLYVPLTKKTMISTLGVHKRGALIRWQDIKGVNYIKPNEKNQIKAKLVYTFAGRETSTELTFNKDDAQLEKFKETAKEYRKIKKKERKNGN